MTRPGALAARGAVFVDRDGVLSALVEREGRLVSPRQAADFRILPGAREAVERLRAIGFLVFVISNQPDVARGFLTVEELDRMTAALRAAVPVDDVVVCPHDDADGCRCRKPQSGMLVDLAARWGVALARSYMIGDSWKDVEAGRAAGCCTVYIGPVRDWKSPPDAVAASLPDAVARIAASV